MGFEVTERSSSVEECPFMPGLVLKNISKRYGDVHALDGLNLEIQDGEFCVIVGPSGSGKTTLLNIIAGFTKPDDGEVIVDGRVYNRLSPRDRNIGMVFQDIALFSHMTVRKNISFGLEIQKKDSTVDIDNRVKKIADRLKIGDLLDKKPGLLSGGEAQRVAIGRTLITDPSFFLFDEPLGNLDADLRMEMLTEIKRLHLNLKKTFVYVTHDQEQALSAASRVMIMKDGRVLQKGHPREIHNNPGDKFVAEFFGVPSMNLIDGTIIPEGDGSLFKGAGLRVKLQGYSQPTEAEVTLGVRPADVIVGSRITEDGFGTINSIELLGDKNHIYLTLDQEQTIIAITPPKTAFQLEQKVRIKLKENKVFLFDRDQGGRLHP
jgi:ABC-type sugar transport system ATPase subunit